MIERKGLLKSKENYIRGAHTLGIVAEQVTSLAVPAQTLTQWGDLLSSFRIVDDRIDHAGSKDKRAQLTARLEAFMDSGTSEFGEDQSLTDSIGTIKDLSQALPEEKRLIFIRSLKRLLKVSEQIKSEKSPKQLSSLTKLEGQISSRPFLVFLPDEYRASPHFSKLQDVLKRLGRIGNSFDTFIDLPTDFRNNETQVPPTPRNRLKLLTGTATDTLLLARELRPSRTMIHELFSLVHDTTQNNSER